MEIVAVQKFIRMSPKKLRYVLPLVKGMTPLEAVEKLPFVGRRAAEPIKKVIVTAIANAKQRGISDTALSFKELQINEGPRMKRWRAGSRGRAKPYVRAMSHIRVVLSVAEPTKKAKVEKVSKEPKAKKDDKKTKKQEISKTKKKETK